MSWTEATNLAAARFAARKEVKNSWKAQYEETQANNQNKNTGHCAPRVSPPMQKEQKTCKSKQKNADLEKGESYKAERDRVPCRHKEESQQERKAP